jgi:hypothetical protein
VARVSSALIVSLAKVVALEPYERPAKQEATRNSKKRDFMLAYFPSTAPIEARKVRIPKSELGELLQKKEAFLRALMECGSYSEASNALHNISEK